MYNGNKLKAYDIRQQLVLETLVRLDDVMAIMHEPSETELVSRHILAQSNLDRILQLIALALDKADDPESTFAKFGKEPEPAPKQCAEVGA
jgi:hypothetical protein